MKRDEIRNLPDASGAASRGKITVQSLRCFYRNVRYEFQRGVITFDDPNQTQPVMNVSVTTTVEQYNLTLTMRGPLDKLTTSYVSDPPLATLLGGSNQNPSARISLQQRVSKNLLFSFSTDVSQPGSEIVQGEYKITKRWSASITRDQLGGLAVDGKYHTRFWAENKGAQVAPPLCWE